GSAGPAGTVGGLSRARVAHFTGVREPGVNRGWPETGARRSLLRVRFYRTGHAARSPRPVAQAHPGRERRRADGARLPALGRQRDHDGPDLAGHACRSAREVEVLEAETQDALDDGLGSPARV